jgi:hypothetical protein
MLPPQHGLQLGHRASILFCTPLQIAGNSCASLAEQMPWPGMNDKFRFPTLAIYHLEGGIARM